ncbi:MAG: hypothetical protein ACLGHN_01780 [Bacteriovoracia bacterium]
MLKPGIILGLLVTTSQVFAASMEVSCEVKNSLDPVFQQKLVLEESDKNKLIGDFNEFSFYLTSKGNEVVELQTLNRYEPTRSYATGALREKDDFVDLAIWKRDYLMEVRCSRL